MTVPRLVLPGTTYLVTRRCSQRQFLLRPSATINQLFLYVLAVAAQRYGIRLHAFCVLSNHYHLVVTDPDARLPAFHQFLDALVARAVNASLGRWEAFWAPNSYSAVTLHSPADVVDKIAYVLANPVAAGLVGAGSAWPGAWSAPAQVGAGAITAARPEHFFDPNGTMPESVTLQLETPPGFASPEAFRTELEAALDGREERARATHRARGGFLGVGRVLAQKPWARPKARERRRGLRPRVAARDKWKRVEVLGRLADFVADYRAAWEEWRGGEDDPLFPAGTYLMRVCHGVRCAAPA